QNLQTSRELLEQAVQLSNTADTDHPLLRLIAPLSRFLLVSGGFSGTQTHVMSSFSDCFDDPDPRVRAAPQGVPAHRALHSGLDDEAEREFQEGLAGFQATGDRWGIAFSLGTLAEAAAGHGEHRAAADYLADALATISELATPEDLCQAQAQYAHELLMI